jgi:4-hydroxy-tetrahydrodipicolinate synthase
LLEFTVAGGLATTVKAGLELWGAGVGDPRRPLLPLDDEGRTALQKLLAPLAWATSPDGRSEKMVES